MNLETFFEKFELFAEAPNAVAKMRELVLELAVRGKLSDQRKDDLTDNESSNILKRQDSTTKILTSNVDLPFAIPNLWRWATLEELGETKPRNNSSDDAIGAFIPMTLIPAEYGKSARHEERLWGEIKKGYTHVANNDLVIAKITPCFENGKSAVMGDLTGGIGAGTTELHVFRNSGDEILPKYALIYVKSGGFIERGIPRMTGSAGQKRVPYDYFARSPFPLPPLAEQKRIVAKVDELMGLCNQLETHQKELETQHTHLARASLSRFAEAPIPENLEFLFHKSYDVSSAELRKSILALAVRGKLVSQDPDEGSSENVLNRIAERREQLIAAKYFRRSPLPNPEEEGTFNIPSSWVWTNLGNSMLNITDGFHSTPKATDSGVRYVTAKHVKPGLIDFESCLYVSEEDFSEISSKTHPQRGDVLVVNIGAGCGLPSIIEVDFEFAFKNVAILNRPDEVNPRFLFNYLFYIREDIFEDRAKGGAQPFLSLGVMREIPFPLPPLAEQRRIVAKVDQLMTLVNQLEVQLDTARSTASNLLDALVGELTKQDQSPPHPTTNRKPTLEQTSLFED